MRLQRGRMARDGEPCLNTLMRWSWLLGLVVVPLACGGTTVTVDGDGGPGAGDAQDGDGSTADGSAADAAGADASCAPTPIHCRCPPGCSCADPVCTKGEWVCPAPVCPADAGSGDGGVACGTKVCATASEFCKVGNGAIATLSCTAYPAACQADHSCTCLQVADPCTFGCMKCTMDSTGGITYSCGCG